MLAQNEPDFELIVVEDSTDETLSWLATRTDTRTSIIRLERRGGNLASLTADWRAFRNAGLLLDWT